MKRQIAINTASIACCCLLAYLMYDKGTQLVELNRCAEKNNVYITSCEYKAQVVTATLLPPPVHVAGAE